MPYTVITNTAGCLPESEPHIVHDYDEVIDLVRSLIHDEFDPELAATAGIPPEMAATLDLLETHAKVSGERGFVLGLPRRRVIDVTYRRPLPTGRQLGGVSAMLMNQQMGSDGTPLEVVRVIMLPDAEHDGCLLVKHSWREHLDDHWSQHDFWSRFDHEGNMVDCDEYAVRKP